jgi:integrase
MIASSRTFCWYFCWYRLFRRGADTNTCGNTMSLTDTAVRNAKAREKAFKLSDGGGLFLLVQPNGTKLWRLAYRFAGKQKALAFGVYPNVSLAEARAQRETAKKSLAGDIDPAVVRKRDKETRVITFRLIADELLKKMRLEGRADATLTKTEWLLEFAYTDLGDRPIGKITAQELLEVLRKIEARGKYETARRLRSTCGMVFRYAIATGRAERDPSVDLRGALITPKVKHRATIVDPKGIGALMRAIDGFEGRSTTKIALRLAPLLFVRPGELRHAEWREIDLEESIWIIPAEKTKMRRPHRVPLARQAIALVKELKKLTGDGRWLFPSVSSSNRPMSENTLNSALRRLGYGQDEITAHGFRAMAATRLNEMGRWNPDVIERQLGHEEQNAVRRAYTHAAEYWSDRVAMMQAWVDYLDELRLVGAVVPIVPAKTYSFQYS